MRIPLQLPPGIVADDTDYATGGWKDASNVRFWRGLPEVIKGWERLTTDLLTGVCRTAFPWKDGTNLQTIAFGLHNGLQVWQAGELVSVTPVPEPAYGSITVSGTPIANETFTVGAQVFTFKATGTATGDVVIHATPATQAANIVTSINRDIGAQVTAAAVGPVVTITADAPGSAGNAIVLSESATGITVSGATLTNGGQFTPGQIDGTGGAGYGTGAYGVGGYGEPSATDYFPLTWSFGARSFGELYANPRGQGVFVWNNDTAVKATLLANAPAKCNFLAVAWTDQVLAFGCTDVGGQFNAACIRTSDPLDPTKWTPGTATISQQYYLKGNGRIVGAYPAGRYFFVWTDSELHLGSFDGTGWSFEPVEIGCGLAGPNAAVVIGQTAYWISPDHQLWACSVGGSPAILPCPIRDEFADNVAPGQDDKITAAYVSERGEIVWGYADNRDGFEMSRQLRLSVLDGAWSRSLLARTAFCGASPSPVGVTLEGAVYWHERGNSADGAPLDAFIESGGQYFDPGERVMLVRGFYPDFREQVGPIWFTVWTKMEAQDEWTEAFSGVCGPGQPKLDFFATGRIVKYRLASNSSPAAWRMGKPTFDVVPVGQR